MNNILPTEFLFTLGPIAILSLALAAVAVSYVFLLIKLGRSEKDKVFLQSKIRDQTSAILLQSHEKGMHIIQEATKKAQLIIEETQVFSDEAKIQFSSGFKVTSKKYEEFLESRTDEVSKLYEKFITDLRSDAEEQFKVITKDMENHSLAIIGEFREALEGERIFMHKELEAKITEEFKKAQTHIEDYKVDQMKKVDKQVFDILHALTSNVLGKSLSLKDHEDLVQRALAKMKVEMESNI
jgi:F0F1-type ATP synthase membrane subunit b/b'